MSSWARHNMTFSSCFLYPVVWGINCGPYRFLLPFAGSRSDYRNFSDIAALKCNCNVIVIWRDDTACPHTHSHELATCIAGRFSRKYLFLATTALRVPIYRINTNHHVFCIDEGRRRAFFTITDNR